VHANNVFDIGVHRQVSKIEWDIFFLVEAGVSKLGKTYNTLLVVMATMEVAAPCFRLFLFIAMLNTNGSMHNLKRTKFPSLYCIIIFSDMLREVDWCLKCTFSHLITWRLPITTESRGYATGVTDNIVAAFAIGGA
jgi:hypothetical protein